MLFKLLKLSKYIPPKDNEKMQRNLQVNHLKRKILVFNFKEKEEINQKIMLGFAPDK